MNLAVPGHLAAIRHSSAACQLGNINCATSKPKLSAGGPAGLGWDRRKFSARMTRLLYFYNALPHSDIPPRRGGTDNASYQIQQLTGNSDRFCRFSGTPFDQRGCSRHKPLRSSKYVYQLSTHSCRDDCTAGPA